MLETIIDVDRHKAMDCGCRMLILRTEVEFISHQHPEGYMSGA